MNTKTSLRTNFLKIAVLVVSVTTASAAHAQMAPGSSAAASAAKTDDEHPLTWHGITIYGTYDIGVEFRGQWNSGASEYP